MVLISSQPAGALLLATQEGAKVFGGRFTGGGGGTLHLGNRNRLGGNGAHHLIKDNGHE
jgi:hypothetical protein